MLAECSFWWGAGHWAIIIFGLDNFLIFPTRETTCIYHAYE